MEDSLTKTLRSAPPALGCWYLTGPTASGKTKVGIELALRLNAEIVSLDSMTVYQGMNIGTAKPSAEDRFRVPHHLLDLVPPSDDFSLSDYIDAAHAKIVEIRGRGKEVLFVGGTPLYLKSLLRGVYQGPPADWEFRAAIERELQSLPLEALHERLQVIDPLLAAKLHPNDKRRIIRGLEVFKLTGQRLSHLQTQFDEGRPAAQAKVFVLSWPRDQLHRRIDARALQMFAAGLVEEVCGLLATYGALSRTALQAVGYREVIEYLRGQGTGDSGPGSGVRSQESEHRGLSDSPSLLTRVKTRTHQFARRQETWFRSLSECTPVAMHELQVPAAVAERIIALRPTCPMLASS
ncbi:MAG TPA: tRNA (adenosine(37)-N6)-dimethylallyltransferase MiaA [Pirellulaceae bacterium]|nr:tRNA (adenosine(37)-N6)-dimethylallyltransferase MiaA [Pirellulaceae bacterium]